MEGSPFLLRNCNWAERIRRFKMNYLFPGISFSHVLPALSFPASQCLCIILMMKMRRKNSWELVARLNCLHLQLQSCQLLICTGINKVKHIWMTWTLQSHAKQLRPETGSSCLVSWCNRVAHLLVDQGSQMTKQARAANYLDFFQGSSVGVNWTKWCGWLQLLIKKFHYYVCNGKESKFLFRSKLTLLTPFVRGTVRLASFNSAGASAATSAAICAPH